MFLSALFYVNLAFLLDLCYNVLKEILEDKRMRVLSVTYSENPIRIGSHYHDAHQLLYVEAGSVEVNIDGEPHRVEAGELVILSRFEEHSVRVLTPIYKRYALRLSALVTFSLKSPIGTSPASFASSI